MQKLVHLETVYWHWNEMQLVSNNFYLLILKILNGILFPKWFWPTVRKKCSYFYGPAAISLYEIFLKILTLCVNVLSIYRGNTRWWIEIRIHSQNGFNPLCIVSSVWRRWLAIVMFFLLFWAKERQEIVFEFDVNC